MWSFSKQEVVAEDKSILVKTIEELSQEKTKLKEEVENLKLKAKISEEDIKHMIKLKEEKNAIELEKKAMKLEKEKDSAIAVVKDQYRDKLETNLVAQKDDIKEMYSQILKRLPDVTARLNIKQAD
jgi:hypothetical protein